MTAPQVATFKPKKSVALSGVTAGNTALCSVGKTGNDLHYRGYDILDVADSCEFEEIAFLLVHGKLPTTAELKGYKAKLKSLRGLPSAVRHVGRWSSCRRCRPLFGRDVSQAHLGDLKMPFAPGKQVA